MIKVCTNCDSDDLRWDLLPRNNSQVGDGQLRMSDVSVIAVLGCNECAETLSIISGDEFLQQMHDTISAAVEKVKAGYAQEQASRQFPK